VRHLEKSDRQGGQKLLIPTAGLLINVDGVCRSCWMAGQVRLLEKRDRHGGQKLLIPTAGLLINVDGVCRSC
jgi:hypothetical protein